MIMSCSVMILKQLRMKAVVALQCKCQSGIGVNAFATWFDLEKRNIWCGLPIKMLFFCLLQIYTDVFTPPPHPSHSVTKLLKRTSQSKISFSKPKFPLHKLSFKILKIALVVIQIEIYRIICSNPFGPKLYTWKICQKDVSATISELRKNHHA